MGKFYLSSTHIYLTRCHRPYLKASKHLFRKYSDNYLFLSKLFVVRLESIHIAYHLSGGRTMKVLFFATLLSVIASGCSTIEPTDGRKFDPKSKVQCMNICKEADMNFQSLVVVAGMAGCVCGVKDADKTSNIEAAMGGVVATILKEKENQKNNSNNSQKPQ